MTKLKPLVTLFFLHIKVTRTTFKAKSQSRTKILLIRKILKLKKLCISIPLNRRIIEANIVINHVSLTKFGVHQVYVLTVMTNKTNCLILKRLTKMLLF